MRKKSIIKVFFIIGVLFGLLWIIPRCMLFYGVCGLIDFSRSKQFDAASWRRYFIGNGLLTWLLSPFNLFIDILCLRNKYIYKLSDLPHGWQDELNYVIATLRESPEKIRQLAAQMIGKERGMCFLRWYGKSLSSTLQLSELDRDFKYVKTIGVSIFNSGQSTSVHYGPLRITLRCLYNLRPAINNNIFIAVGGKRYYWHDNPLFIFDDTLVHQSVNQSSELRYCLFIDIIRPSLFPIALHFFVSVIRATMLSVNRIFYKNWEMIK